MLASGVQPSDSVIYIHESILFQVIFQFIITEYWTSFPVISWFLLVQFSSVTQLCLAPCDPMDCSMASFPVHHQLPELAQTHVHWFSDAIQPYIVCRPLLLMPSIFPRIRVFPKGQFFTSGSQSIGVSASTSVLPMNTQEWSLLRWTVWFSLHSKGLSRVFSNTTVQKHQFFGAQLSSQSNFHIHTWPLEKP